MADPIRVSGPVSGNRQDARLRNRQAGPAEPGRGRRLHRRHDGADDGERRRRRASRHRLLPLDRRRRGACLRRRQDPRFVLPSRGPSDRGRHPDLPVDGPPAATFVRRPASATRHRSSPPCIGADQQNPHDVLSINAASAALMISGIPFEGPIGAVRIAFTTDGKWIPHPTFEESDASTFELVVAGRRARRRRRGDHDGRGRWHGEELRLLRRRGAEGRRGGARPLASTPPSSGSRSRSSCSASSSPASSPLTAPSSRWSSHRSSTTATTSPARSSASPRTSLLTAVSIAHQARAQRGHRRRIGRRHRPAWPAMSEARRRVPRS